MLQTIKDLFAHIGVINYTMLANQMGLELDKEQKRLLFLHARELYLGALLSRTKLMANRAMVFQITKIVLGLHKEPEEKRTLGDLLNWIPETGGISRREREAMYKQACAQMDQMIDMYTTCLPWLRA
jgi:hypothetical protein